MIRRLRAERLTDPTAQHGEGPCWDEATGRLLWCDMLDGRLLVTEPGTGRTSPVPAPEPVVAIVRPAAAGGYVVVGERTVFGVSDLAAAPRWSALAALPLGPDIRANDGDCGPDGCLYVGTMAYAETAGAGQVFRVTGTGQVSLALDGTTVSNGTRVSAAGDSVLFIDSPTRTIRRYRISEGRWHSPRVVVDLDDQAGVPDGLTVDASGGMWVACWDGGQVLRYTADGQLDTVLELPLRRPTACALGGPGLRTLFITTSAHQRAPGSDPDAGAVFAVEVDCPGRPDHPFAGAADDPSDT